MKRLTKCLPFFLPVLILLVVITAQAGNTQNEFFRIYDTSAGYLKDYSLTYIGTCSVPGVDVCKEYWAIYGPNEADGVTYAKICVSTDTSTWYDHDGWACSYVNYNGGCTGFHDAEYVGNEADGDCTDSDTYTYAKRVADSDLNNQDYSFCGAGASGPAIKMRYQYTSGGNVYERHYYVCEDWT